MTLYYLGEMTSKEIGKFLGVSVKTVHSRLHRARKRLQEKDELLVSEVLGGVQLPTNLIENITRQVADMKPTPTSGCETAAAVGGFWYSYGFDYTLAGCKQSIPRSVSAAV